jgi:hypothetical protein
MDILSAFPGKYRKAADYEKPAVLAIDVVYKEAVGQEKETKPVIYFKDEDPRGLVLNKTNANMLATLFGRETGTWKGKEVELYSTKVQFGMEMVDSIRIREAPEPFYDDDVPELTA